MAWNRLVYLSFYGLVDVLEGKVRMHAYYSRFCIPMCVCVCVHVCMCASWLWLFWEMYQLKEKLFYHVDNVPEFFLHDQKAFSSL